MDLTLVTLLVFLAVTVLAGALGMLVRDLVIRRRQEVNRRLGVSDGERRIGLAELAVPEAAPDTFTGRIDNALARLVGQAGLGISPQTALLLQIGTGVVSGGLMFVWCNDVLAGLAGYAAGMAVPLAYFAVRRSRRLRAMEEQLPDTLDLLARVVRAGESLDQAIALTGREAAEPLATELRRCSQQLEMGLSLTVALESLARRVPLMDVRILATTLLVHRRTGGTLAPTLERLAAVVRDRLACRRQFRAATAGGRLSAILIASVGPLAFLYFLTWQPEYVRNFFEQPQGWAILLLAGALQLLGLTWVARTLRAEY